MVRNTSNTANIYHKSYFYFDQWSFNEVYIIGTDLYEIDEFYFLVMFKLSTFIFIAKIIWKHLFVFHVFYQPPVRRFQVRQKISLHLWIFFFHKNGSESKFPIKTKVVEIEWMQHFPLVDQIRTHCHADNKKVLKLLKLGLISFSFLQRFWTRSAVDKFSLRLYKYEEQPTLTLHM